MPNKADLFISSHVITVLSFHESFSRRAPAMHYNMNQTYLMTIVNYLFHCACWWINRVFFYFFIRYVRVSYMYWFILWFLSIWFAHICYWMSRTYTIHFPWCLRSSNSAKIQTLTELIIKTNTELQIRVFIKVPTNECA